MKEKDYNLQIYKGKKGYRWRFIVDGNIKCIGTDWSPNSRQEAFNDAKDILGNIWNIGELENDI